MRSIVVLMPFLSRPLTVCTAFLLLFGLSLAAAATDRPVQALQEELRLAIQQGERSLEPHTPGSGHTKQHMQRMLNIIEGKNGVDFNKEIDTPGDGQGLLTHVSKLQESFGRENVSPDVRQALEQVNMLLQEAAEHAKRSVKATSVPDTHRHAALAAGLLTAAAGQQHASSPISGALAYVSKAGTKSASSQ